MKNTYNQEEIVDLYTIHGVPSSYLTRMCKELKISENKLNKWLEGQTCGLVGGEAMIYPWDIKRFLKGLPNND